MALDYTKETALYQPDAIGNGISDARGEAKRYITSVIDSGIFVHTEESPMPTVPETTGNNGVHISDDVDIIANGVNVASYGTSARIGVETSDHVTIDSNGLSIYDGARYICSFEGYEENSILYNQMNLNTGSISGYTQNSKNYLEAVCGDASIKLREDGGIYCNGHSTSIGSIETDTRTTADLTSANVSSYANGAAVTLYPGVYTITGQATFPKRYKAIGDSTEPDYTNLEIQIYNLTSGEVLGRQRIVVYKNAVTVLQAHCNVTIPEADVEATTGNYQNIAVRVSAGYCCDGPSTTISAMRIC